MLEIASNGVDSKKRGCMWWYIICGLILAAIIIWTMKWSIEYGESMFGELKETPKKQKPPPEKGDW
jgi:hypothetical protein